MTDLFGSAAFRSELADLGKARHRRPDDSVLRSVQVVGLVSTAGHAVLEGQAIEASPEVDSPSNPAQQAIVVQVTASQTDPHPLLHQAREDGDGDGPAPKIRLTEDVVIIQTGAGLEVHAHAK